MNNGAILDMRGVTKVYGSGEAAVMALDKVDFQANTGEVVVVMGPSGAGKTTFLTIAGALLRPTSGEVWISGTNIIGLGEGQLPEIRRRRIGFVFQSFNLLDSLSSLENVALVMTADRAGRGGRDRASELLSLLGLGHRLKSTPSKLSGGEKQRVAIARALANNPDLILADEPTANLDSVRGREVMLLLRQIAFEMGKAVVIVSHDHRTREVASRIVWLEDGTFRSDVETTRDPVCERVIEVNGAPKFEYEAAFYYFCGDNCLKIFSGEPVRYVVKE
ncbi:MAG: ATP-binding cassette domain-containing protein [Dehalococcoidia bacterium]